MNTSLGTGTLDRRGFLLDSLKLVQRTGLEMGNRNRDNRLRTLTYRLR